MIIDTFIYFNEKELLELRINLLHDYVDKFIIFEGNMTFSGIPKPFTCEDTLRELGFKMNKIEVVKVYLPPNEVVVKLEEFDHHLMNRSLYTSDTHPNTWYRERVQKDSLTSVLEDYGDEDVFIVTNCDEIINPRYIKYFSEMVLKNKHILIKLPLVQLEGRADMRAYDRATGQPVMFDKIAFMCTKEHLTKAPPSNLQFQINSPYTTCYITQDDKRIEDCGWHFSWMGSSEKKLEKLRSYSHYADEIPFLLTPKLNSDDMRKYMENYEAKEFGLNPWGDTRYILKKYPESNLPQIIFDLPRVKKHLLPD